MVNEKSYQIFSLQKVGPNVKFGTEIFPSSSIFISYCQNSTLNWGLWILSIIYYFMDVRSVGLAIGGELFPGLKTFLDGKYVSQEVFHQVRLEVCAWDQLYPSGFVGDDYVVLTP